MLDEIKALARSQSLCVLATADGGKPHCSLMAYIISDDCRRICMFTPKSTAKYRNVRNNPFVSLLIDDRSDASRKPARALTVYGEYLELDNPGERDRLLSDFIMAHPHLKAFALQDDIEPLVIGVTAFLYLKGPSESHFFDISA